MDAPQMLLQLASAMPDINARMQQGSPDRE